MTQACLPLMAYGSAIVNTGSVTALLGNKSLLDYSTTKGGIHAFTRSLSGQLIWRGIGVNAVAPGPVWTPLNGGQRGTGRVPVRSAHSDEASRSARRNRSCLCISRLELVFELHHREVLPIVGGY